MPAGDPASIRIGLHWNSGATEELLIERYQQYPRTSAAAVDLARQLGPAMDNKALAAALNAAGHRTAHGRPFDLDSAGNLRTYYKISYPPQAGRGELTVPQAATRLGVSVQTIKYWIDHGYLTASRGPAGRYAIPFSAEVEAACQQRAASSFHQHKDIQTGPRRDGEHSVPETASLLGVRPPRIYAWIKDGTLPARRGPGARLWITLTPQTESTCRDRITATTPGKPSNA
jgi:hypothetical protein